MINDSALVSVVIPTYKRSELLSNAINSVLTQTYPNIEIIVVDDNDPDSEDRQKTRELMRLYNHEKKVKYICHPENLNGSAARNTGIRNSSGKYIAFLDDDDEFLPDKIQLQVEKLESLDDSWGICYTQFIRKKGGKLIDKGIERREGHLSAEILKGTFYISAGSNIIIKKEVVDKIGGFNEYFSRRQDLEFLIRASQITKVAHVSKVCLVINKNDPANIITERALERNTAEFLEIFAPYIAELPASDQKKVRIAQSLNSVRYYLLQLKLRAAFRVCRQNDIGGLVLVRYTGYLLKRKLLKQCYGFGV